MRIPLLFLIVALSWFINFCVAIEDVIINISGNNYNTLISEAKKVTKVDVNKRYIFVLPSIFTLPPKSSNSDPFPFKNFRYVTIRGKTQTKIITDSKDPFVAFSYSETTSYVTVEIENLVFSTASAVQIQFTGKGELTVRNCTFKENKKSSIYFTSGNSLTIENCVFKSNKIVTTDSNVGEKPQIYVDNGNSDQKIKLKISNTIGESNTNDIKDVTSSGGWGYFSKVDFEMFNVTSIKNYSDNNGGLYSIITKKKF